MQPQGRLFDSRAASTIAALFDGQQVIQPGGDRPRLSDARLRQMIHCGRSMSARNATVLRRRELQCSIIPIGRGMSYRAIGLQNPGELRVARLSRPHRAESRPRERRVADIP